MQLSLPRHFLHSACAAALAAGLLAGPWPSAALAAELGEVAVRSHIGQQLSADIELVMLTPEDAAGVQVKLAAPNVYQGANTRLHPALSSLRMTVMKRDNRQFLHLTTLQPVDAEILHLFLELGTGSRASVRSATLWLTAEPAPKLAPLRPPAPESASAVADMMAADAALAATQSAQTAQGAEARAAALRAARMRAAAQNVLAARDPAAARADHAAGSGHGGGAAMPAARSAASAVAAGAAAPIAPGPAAVPIKLTPEARTKQGRPGEAKAACAPGQSSEDAQQCQALDKTNAELKTKLLDLEGKVRQLQAALGQGAAVAAAPGAAPAAAGSAVPAPGSASASATAAPGGASAPAAAAAAASASAGPSASSASAGPSASAASALASASEPAPAALASAASAASRPADAATKAAARKKASGVNTTTLVVGGGLLLALVLGLLVYYIRKKKFKFSTAPLKVWQGWRKGKKPAEAEAAAPAEPILGNE